MPIFAIVIAAITVLTLVAAAIGYSVARRDVPRGPATQAAVAAALTAFSLLTVSPIFGLLMAKAILG